MRKRNHPRFDAATADPTALPWFYVLLTILCAGFLAVGFFFAARQHFAAMDLGMKNSNLRQQIEAMESQQRQLTLAREVVRSPGEVMRIALNRGFQEKQDGVMAVNASNEQIFSKPLIERTSLITDANAVQSTRKPIKAFLPVAGSKPIVPVISKGEVTTRSAKVPSENVTAIAKLR